MDHLQRSRLNLLTSHMLDRGGLLRLDPALIAEQAADQRARFLGIRHMRIAVDLRDPERPAWLTAEEAADRFGQCESRVYLCLLYTSPSPRDRTRSRMPSSA